MDETLARILALISKHGLTDLQFQKEIGLYATAVAEWKNGKSRSYIKHIHKIAAYFNVSADYLLGTAPQKPKTPREELAALPNVYFRLAQGARELDLSDRDVDFILGIAREMKEKERRAIETERARRNKKDNED